MLQPSRPRVVCLCGSTRFRDAFERAAHDEALAGRIVLSVGVFSHADGEALSGDQHAGLVALHRAKIEMADEILVLNVGGYCGSATSEELLYARQLGKTIRYLEPGGTETRLSPDLAPTTTPFLAADLASI